MKYSYSPPWWWKIVGVLFSCLGLGLLGLLVVQRDYSFESTGLVVSALVFALVLIGNWRSGEFSIDESGRARWRQKWFLGAWKERSFSLGDVSLFEVVGTINWVSVIAQLHSGESLMVAQALPRTSAGKTTLQGLVQVARSLNKPIQIDEQVAQWYDVPQ